MQNRPIHHHIKQLFQQFYSQPYLESETENNTAIQRLIHGITHTASAALTIWVLVNFRKSHGDKTVDSLSHDDIFHLQIAALLHDSARQDEEEDRWDLKSAMICYHYLKNELNLSHTEAKRFAEAIANKDINDSYHVLIIDEHTGLPDWQTQPVDTATFKKDLLYQLMHDVDCLEVIRARDEYKGEKLDLLQWLSNTDNAAAITDFAYLLSEYKGFIIARGDTHCDLDIAKKEYYEQDDAGLKILTLWDSYPALKAFYNEGNLLHDCLDLSAIYQACYAFTDKEKELQQKMRQGKILLRAVPVPSALDDDKKSDNKLDKYPDKITLEIEKANRGSKAYKGYSRIIVSDSEPLLKMMKPNTIVLLLQDKILTAYWLEQNQLQNRAFREDEVTHIIKLLPNHTKKSKHAELIHAVVDQFNCTPTQSKNNSLRSCSLASGFIGGHCYVGVGLLLEANLDQVVAVNAVDFDTGRGKKEYYADLINTAKLDTAAAQSALDQLLSTHKINEIQRPDEDPSKHPEILYNIKYSDFIAIYFSVDQTIYTTYAEGGKQPQHHAMLLQAIYIQKQYEKLYSIKLPIIEYSTTGKPLKFVEVSDALILKLWEKAVSHYLNNESDLSLLVHYFCDDSNDILKRIKIHSINAASHNMLSSTILSTDNNYPIDLITKINERILPLIKQKEEELKKQYENTHFWELEDEQERTALSIALERFPFTYIENLIAKGADLEVVDSEGHGPLYHAIINNNPEAVTAFIQAGAMPDEVDSEGNSLLHYAALGDSSVLKNLLPAITDLNPYDLESQTPLHYAIESNMKENIEILIHAGAELNANFNDGQTMLTFTYLNKMQDIVDLLLHHGASPNFVDNTGNNLLHYAVQMNDLPLVELLLAHPDIRLNLPNADGDTALQLAYLENHSTLFNLLFQAKANPSVANKQGYSLLHYAVVRQDEKSVRQLLTSPNSMINMTDAHGRTALHYAAMNGLTKICSLLLSASANPNIRDHKNKTPLSFAKANSYDDIVETLLTKGAKEKTWGVNMTSLDKNRLFSPGDCHHQRQTQTGTEVNASLASSKI